MFSLQTRLLLLWGLAALLLTAAWAQTSKGIIAGAVSDKTGAVIAGARVTATSKESGETRTVTTSPNGAYRIEAVNPGNYRIAVAAPGFASLTLDNVDVKASVVTSVDAKLDVGQVSEMVQVEARLPEIQTENGELSHSIDEREVRQLPLLTLNPIELVLTEPGVTAPSSRDDFTNGVGFVVNGTRPRANNFLIDSQDNNDNSINGQAFQPANPEAIQEVSVLTNSFAAEFGRGGGAVTNVIYKSGTNSLHGAVYDRYQGSGLNALTAGQHLSGVTTKPRFDQHTFGFALGGPAIKNKLFFFGTSAWDRFYGKAAPATLRLPTPAGVAALQSIGPNSQVDLLLNYFNGLRGDPNQSPRTLNIGDRAGCGSPCLVETGLTRRAPPAQQQTDTQWNVKVDFLPRQQDTFSFRYVHDRSTLSPDFFNFATSLPGLDPQQGGPSESAGLSWTHVLSPSVVNEFRASESRINFTFGPTPEAAANPLFQRPTITSIAGTGFPQLGINSALPQGRGHDVYQVQDAMSITHGNHTFKFGVDIARLLVKDLIPFNSRGTLAYGNSPGFSGLANFVDDFSGISSGASISFGNPLVQPHVTQQAYYFQDSWRVLPNLTLTAGLRYEFQPNPTNVLSFPAVDLSTEPSNTFPVPVRAKDDINNFGPRFSFAYTPRFWKGLFGDSKTVLRGGYGLFYDTLFTNIVDNVAAAAPNAVTGLLQGTTGRGLANASQLVSQVQPRLSPLNSVSSIDRNLVNPLTHQWNFNVQRELPWDNTLTVAYVGTRGERLFVNDELNPGLNLVRINPNRGSIAPRTNGGDSIYHGLDVKVDHRFRHGLLLRAAYTWSKLIDNGSEVFITSGGSSFPQNEFPGGRQEERGLSAFDHRQRLVLTYVYEIPSLPKSEHAAFAAVRYLLGNWQVSGTTAFQTGAPETVSIQGIDTNGDLRSTNDRPSLGSVSAPITSFGVDGSFVGGTPGTLYDGQTFFNGAGDLVPVSATSVRWLIQPGLGNVGRNSVLNPGRQDWNFALTRRFKMPREGHQLEFRGEFFNPFNHPNLGPSNKIDQDAVLGVSYNLLDPDFANTLITRNGGRTIRLWLRYSF